MLAIDLPGESDRIGPLWELVRSEALSSAILDEVVRAGLASAPHFVLVSSSSETITTVLVRGSVVIRIAGQAGDREISGAGVSSWVEQVVDASSGYEFQIGSRSASSALLPLASGVVRADALQSSNYCGHGIAEAPIPESVPVQPPKPHAPVLLHTKESHAQPATELAGDLEATLAAQTMTVSPTPLAPPAPPRNTGDGSSYDHLFGETVFRKVEDAAVREPEGAEIGPLIGSPPAPPQDDDGGDHDGHTVMVSDLAALRAKRKAARATAPVPLPQLPTLYLELSTGGREQLDQPLIIGRAPSASRVPGGNVPRLVSMNTPNQDISRTHAQITAEGGTVVVTDLHSSNGTTITLPGKPAQKLRPGEPSAVIVGTVIDLGDGATLTVCESS